MSLNVQFKWDRRRFMKFFRYMLTKDGEKIITRHMAKATQRNGLEVVRLMRQVVKSAPFQKNAKLTVALKKSSRPLVDTGTLFNAINATRLNDLEVFVGVHRTEKMHKIAEVVHGNMASRTSYMIPVTPRMRGMFYLLWKASVDPKYIGDLRGRAKELWDMMPGGWSALKEDTSHIKIPSRPFAEITFKDPKIIGILKKNWDKGLDDAIKEIVRRAS